MCGPPRIEDVGSPVGGLLVVSSDEVWATGEGRHPAVSWTGAGARGGRGWDGWAAPSRTGARTPGSPSQTTEPCGPSQAAPWPGSPNDASEVIPRTGPTGGCWPVLTLVSGRSRRSGPVGRGGTRGGSRRQQREPRARRRHRRHPSSCRVLHGR